VRGKAGLYLNKYDQAISDFTAALQLKSNEKLNYSYRAFAYCQQKQKALAAEDERRAIELGGSLIEKCQ
jgi:tetratricopeptide (TPR) repeat protein